MLRITAFVSALFAGAACVPAAAQSYQDDEVTGGERFAGTGSERARTVRVEPYIEASQVVVAEISPGDDVATYTQLATGVDASVQGRNNGGSVSLRYEKNIGYSDDALDSDSLTGIARGYATVTPGVTVEAGGLASRTRIDGSGGTGLNPVGELDSESRIYSAYVGPNFATRRGPIEATANYRFGYTRVEAPDAVLTGPDADPVDIFDESTSHSANARIGLAPRTVLPVGVGIGSGYYREDIDNLDQRIENAYVRGDVTVPLAPDLSVVAGVGYEDVEVSSRDALVDADGVPVIGADGRFVTDEAGPRRIAFESDGLIYDVGVVWRPSPRTAFEAHVGKRYDSTNYYGSFAYAPDARSSLNISVYEGLSGFGGLLTDSLAALPTDFEVSRNALTGNLDGCVSGVEGRSCVTGALGSVRSSIFRSRGIAASYDRRFGRLSAGLGAGYDRRRFIAAEDSVLAAADGIVDETYYVTGFVGTEIGRTASVQANAYATYTDTGFAEAGDVRAYGGSASYSQSLTQRISARAAIAIDHFDSELSEDDLTAASALVGVRMNF